MSRAAAVATDGPPLTRGIGHSAVAAQPFQCRETSVPYRAEAAVGALPPRERSLLRCDALALSLSVALDRIVPALARAAAAFCAASGWKEFGYARAGDHARERFGRSGRWLRELAALGTALKALAGLGDALAGSDGGRPIGRVAASIIARVATPESLAAWIGVARSVPVRTLREFAARARGEGSSWPPEGDDPDASVNSAAFLPGVVVGAEKAGPFEDDDPDSRVLVRMMVPPPVAAAFDEALDLYRAVSGGQATVTEFVEALVADAQAGPHPVDAQPAPLGGSSVQGDGALRAFREKALARSTQEWRHLADDAGSSPGWAFALAGATLAAVEDICSRAGTGDQVELDGQIRALIRLEDDLERRLARLLADLAGQNAWARLRFDSVGHYAEQRLGMSRSAAQDRVRALRGLSRLPLVGAAYERGEIGLDAALLLVRILGRGGGAGEAKQRAWVERAREASIKRLRDEERLIGRVLAVGAPAGSPRGNAPERWDRALAAQGGMTGSTSCDTVIMKTSRGADTRPMPPDDAAWQRSLRREPGTARRRISRYGRVALDNPDAGAFFRLRLPAELASGFLSCVESARARLAGIVEEVPWDQPWPGGEQHVDASVLCARMFSIRCRRSPAWVGLLAVIEEFVETWDDPGMSPQRQEDAIYIRDGWRCTAPGCTSRRNLESHHLVYRSRGGSDDHANLTCLCRFHHQLGEHGGLARCRGSAPLGIDWALGRRGAGGRWRNEIRLGQP